MIVCERRSPRSLTQGRLCLLRLITVCDSNIQQPQWRLPDAGQQGSSNGWGEQDWGASQVRKAGRLGLEPLLWGVSLDCSDSLPCHIIMQRWEQPWVCPGLEPLLLKHFWIADEFMLMRRLQITVNIKSSSGTPGVNISQRLPTSLCFSFASYKAIKRGRKKNTTKQQNPFPVTGKTPLSWQQSVLRNTLQHYKLVSPSGQSDCCSSASLPPFPMQMLLLTLDSSMLTTICSLLIFTIIPDGLYSVYSLETPPRRQWVCVMSHA